MKTLSLYNTKNEFGMTFFHGLRIQHIPFFGKCIAGGVVSHASGYHYPNSHKPLMMYLHKVFFRHPDAADNRCNRCKRQCYYKSRT